MKYLIFILLILSSFKTYTHQSGIKYSRYIDITSYQAKRSQTDAHPCISASGMNICKSKGTILAISRDLLSIYEFGDTLQILTQEGDTIKGVIQDVMNERFRNRVDVLTNKHINTKGWLL